MIYNKGSHAIGSGAKVYGTAVVKMMLLGPGYTPNIDDDDILAAAAAEIAVAGYARQTLGTKVVTNNTTLNRTVYTAASVPFGNLPLGGQIAFALVYIEDTDDDHSIPWSLKDLRVDVSGTPTPVPTNGGAVTVGWTADGVAYIQTQES